MPVTSRRINLSRKTRNLRNNDSSYRWYGRGKWYSKRRKKKIRDFKTNTILVLSIIGIIFLPLIVDLIGKLLIYLTQ